MCWDLHSYILRMRLCLRMHYSFIVTHLTSDEKGGIKLERIVETAPK